MKTWTEPGQGRKQCPKCGIYIAAKAKLCVCEGGGQEKPKEITTWSEGGKGRKPCVCGKFVPARTTVCPACDHSFDKPAPAPAPQPQVEEKAAEKTEETKPEPKNGNGHAPTRVEQEAQAFAHRFGGGGMVIIAPAGACPVKLDAIDRESVEKWCEAVVHSGQQQGKLYSPHALTYFARQFVEIFADEGGYSPEYLAVKQAIYEWAQIDGLQFTETPTPVAPKRYLDGGSTTYIPRAKTELYEDEQEDTPRERDDRETLTVGKTSFGSDD